MKFDKAIELGFVLGEDGSWRRPVMQKRKDGALYPTMQRWIVKTCPKCGEDFLAAHAKDVFCTISCKLKGNTYGTAGKGTPHEGYRRGKFFGVGTKRVSTCGYVEIHLPGHILADKHGRVAEHRLVMSEHIRRPIEKTEHVHHINGDRSDNRIENLVILTKSHHNSIHKKEQVKNFKRDDAGKFIHSQTHW